MFGEGASAIDGPPAGRRQGPAERYPSREEASAAFAAHVNRGKVRALEAIGVDIVIGERQGPASRTPSAAAGTGTATATAASSTSGTATRRRRGGARRARPPRRRQPPPDQRLARAPRRAARGEHRRRTSRSPSSRPSGTESVDLALRLARAHTGRARDRRRRSAPTTASAASRSPPATRAGSSPFGPAPEGFAHVPYNDAEAIREAIDPQTAAVILESIPATLGFPAPAPGYLAAVADAAREAGALLILDEVQTGLGRTGTHWYYEQQGVEPDMLITGKGLGGGIYPISAVLLRPELEEFFDANPFAYVSTFGGAEIGCVAAFGRRWTRSPSPGFLDRVERLGAAVRARLRGDAVRARAATG